MGRWIKRLVILLVVGAGGTAALRTLRQKTAVPATVGPSSEWPPFERQSAPVKAGAVGDLSTSATAASPDWVLPIDGVCPDGFPIKANDNSRIFHVPGGRSYARTVADRCYASVEAAERDGYRQAKA